jgi:hypothetical protein
VPAPCSPTWIGWRGLSFLVGGVDSTEAASPLELGAWPRAALGAESVAEGGVADSQIMA